MAVLRVMTIFISLVAMGLGGCAHNIAVPSTPASSVQFLTLRQADRLWETVLEKYVDERGRINFAGVKRDPADLHAYVIYVGHISPANRPELFPTVNDRIAYYLNSYNALALYGVTQLDPLKGFERLSDRASFFALTRHRVGGRWISLLDYENKVIRPLGEPRVHFALNCMVKGCPRLPKQVYRANRLETQLEQGAREFLNETRNVRVAAEKKQVELSQILEFYEEDFVNPQTATSLVSYLNRYRTPPVPEKFNVRFIPYDWSLNHR